MNLYDFTYGVGVGLTAPYWLLRGAARRKVRDAFSRRMGRALPAPPAGDGKLLFIHAVSVGEVNAVPALIESLRRRRPSLRFVVSTTTQTGGQRAAQLFSGADIATIHFPLDFTSAIARVLAAYHPSVVVLMELEVWPNFTAQCVRRGIPVVVANGRVTLPAMRRYRWGGWLTRRMFARVSAAAVQDPTYAERFAALGVSTDRIEVLGTMKFDSATLADAVEGDRALADHLGLTPGSPLWVCGSTGPGEERLVLDAYRRVRAEFSTLRLAIVPRHPPRFDEVARLIESSGFQLLRRSGLQNDTAASSAETSAAVILGDTMGELRKLYSLATVVLVGRTLVDLGARQAGSDMIEPTALAKPVIVGPHTGNFDMPMRLLRAADAIREVPEEDAPALATAVQTLLSDPTTADAMGRRAQDVIRAARGATDRHAELIERFL